MVHRVDRQDCETPFGGGRDHVAAQHQVLDITSRDDDALIAGQTRQAAGVEEPLDLLVDPADRLNLAMLIDRAGHGETLFDRRLCKRREQREQLGGRGAVSVDPAVGLLEDDAGAKRQRSRAAKAAAEKAGQDQDALRMQRAAERDLPFDIDDLAAAQSHLCGDPRGIAKIQRAEADHRNRRLVEDAMLEIHQFDIAAVPARNFLPQFVASEFVRFPVRRTNMRRE